MYSIQEILSLLAVQYNKSLVKELAEELTKEECNSRMLSKKTQEAFGLKKPKLSKALIDLGLPQKAVSLALASSSISEIPRISAEVEDLLEMGDSVHYKSCQRTGGPLRTVEELLPFLGTSLWVYVVGERQSLNGSGFKARRLLRMMYHDAECTKPAGVYLETVYGDLSLLPDEEVQRFFELPLFDEEMYTKQQVPLFCPSAEYGYNDTLERGVEQFFYRPVECKTSKSIVVQAYQTRPKSAFAYICSLAENRYNPQNGKFSAPPLEKGWRGFINSNQRELISSWIEVFGYPQQTFEIGLSVSSVLGDCVVSVRSKQNEPYFFYRNIANDFPKELLALLDKKLVVFSDAPELGFWKPVSLFERWIKKEGEPVTTDEIALAEFWIDSFGYPAEGENFSCVRHRLKITHRGYNFVVLLNNGEKCIILESDGVRREEYLYTHSLYHETREVWYTAPELGFWQATSLDLAKATLACSNMLGFCPVEVGEDFCYGEYKLSIFLNSAREYSLILNVPADRFPKTLLEVKEDSLKVKYNLPELGFLKAIPIINYQVNDNLWVTGPLPTK